MPTLDREGLREEFNMTNEVQVLEPVEEENTIDEFELEWDDETADGTVLRSNIDKANALFDRISTEMDGGNFSARMVEVAGQIINSITTASKVLIDDTNYNKYLDIRKALALLKRKEVEIRYLKGGRKTNNNLIIASREDVLKMLKEKTERDSENN